MHKLSPHTLVSLVSLVSLDFVKSITMITQVHVMSHCKHKCHWQRWCHQVDASHSLDQNTLNPSPLSSSLTCSLHAPRFFYERESGWDGFLSFHNPELHQVGLQKKFPSVPRGGCEGPQPLRMLNFAHSGPLDLKIGPACSSGSVESDGTFKC